MEWNPWHHPDGHSRFYLAKCLQPFGKGRLKLENHFDFIVGTNTSDISECTYLTSDERASKIFYQPCTRVVPEKRRPNF